MVVVMDRCGCSDGQVWMDRCGSDRQVWMDRCGCSDGQVWL